MDQERKNLVMVYFLAVIIATAPLIGYGLASSAEKEFAAASASGADFFSPQTWFKILQQNITIPTFEEEPENPSSTIAGGISMFGPQLKEINEKIKNKTGIDFIKFFTLISEIIISLLQKISDLFSNIPLKFQQ